MPEIEIANLRPLDRADPEEAASRHPEAGRVPRLHKHLAGLAGTGARGTIQVKVGRWQAVIRIYDDRLHGTARGGIFGRMSHLLLL